MERFIIEKDAKRDDHWVCVDQVNGLACQFEHGNSRHTQSFGIKHGIERPDDITLDSLCVEMENWLWDNHRDKLIAKTNDEPNEQIMLIVNNKRIVTDQELSERLLHTVRPGDEIDVNDFVQKATGLNPVSNECAAISRRVFQGLFKGFEVVSFE